MQKEYIDEDRDILEDIKSKTDRGYNNSQVTRERAADDLVFYHISQWDDNLLDTSDLSYRGQFDKLHKAVRQITAELQANAIQVDFQPIDISREDDADLLDGLYRSDDRVNSSQESYWNAQVEQIVCGVGGWYLYTEYETLRNGNRNHNN